MAKKKVEKPRREFTKRQLSRWQHQKRRQRIIFGLAILVIVAVVAVVGIGFYNHWYVPEYKPLHETVIEVNGTKFNMNYYISLLEFYYSVQGIPAEYLLYISDEVVRVIEQNELIRQGAMELGFTVSGAEVKEIIEGYGYDDIPAIRDAIRAQLLLIKLSDEYFEEEVPKFAEQRHIMAMFLESESQVNEVMARIEAGEDFAALAAELSLDDFCKENEGDLGWRPQGVLSLSALIGSSILEENAFNCEAGVLSQPIYEETKTKMVGYWLIEIIEWGEVEEEEAVGEEEEEEVDEEEAVGEEEEEEVGEEEEEEVGEEEEEEAVDEEEEEEAVDEEEEEEEVDEEEEEEVELQATVKVMLLGSEEEANEVRARLEEGEDFATLAEEFSQHDASKENGGEFDLTSAETISSAFNDFVFDPEVELGTLSQPIRDEEVSTEGGYWLIEVVDIDDNKEIDEDNRNLLKGDALTKWVEALWDDPDNNIVSYLDDEKKQWAIVHAIED